MKVILDPGSCHQGDLDKAVQLVVAAVNAGADAIKFQLFKDIKPNIPLNYDWIPILKKTADECGIELFASVWDMEGLEILRDSGCKSIKFAHSQRNSDLIGFALQHFEHVYVSMDYMDYPIENAVNLFCIPKYPVYSELNFDCIFDRFHGFSDHTLGYAQTVKAVRHGARYIEKHFRLDNTDMRIPDARFALTTKQVKEMIDEINKTNKKDRLCRKES